MPELKLYIFGSPHLEHQGNPVHLNLRKALALVSYLAVSQESHSRDSLATLFWPEQDQSSARASLRRTLYTINKAAGVEIVDSDLDSVSISRELDTWIDVQDFRSKIGELLLSDGNQEMPSDASRIAALEETISLYRDDFLAGFTLPDCPEFDEWQFFEAESLRTSLENVLQQLISLLDDQSETIRAIEYARRWLMLDLLNESAHRCLMELYAKSGQQAAALRQYQECERILSQELKISPATQTIELHENIRLLRDTCMSLKEPTGPEVKYVPSGDVYIAYQVLGQGPVDIVFVCGYVSHLHQFWEEPSMAGFFDQLAKFSRLILFDKRGVGLSDRVGYPPTLEDTMDDILAVMRAVDSKHAVLFGIVEGGPTSVLFAATYPERVSGLVLYETSAKWTRTEDYPWAITPEQYDRWLEYIVKNWGEPLNLDIFAPSRAHEPQLRDWWAKSLRLASSPGGMKAVLEVMRDIDVREILPAIRTPTLILHRKDDKAIRIGAGRYLAGQIPGAKYIELEGQDTWFFVGDSQPILREIKTFVQNLSSPILPERILATILIVEVTGYKENAHTQAPNNIYPDPIYIYLQQEVKRYRGREVCRQAFHYVATFDGPSRAIQCAQEIVDGAGHKGIELRAGLHTGECEFTQGLLTGGAMVIAQFALKSAGKYEIVASGTVKDLVVGAGFRFDNRGKHPIEGVAGEWRLFSVI